jgi:glucose/arabinose dehydrogenase
MTRPVIRPLRRRLGAALAVAALGAALLPLPAAASIRTTSQVDGASVAPAVPGPGSVKLTKLVDVAQPVLAIGSGDGSGRLFIVQKTGRIRIYHNGALRSTPFLNISSLVSKGSEQGLLGLAFHPSFKTNRKFYVDYTDRAGDTVIREYRASSSNPNVVAAGSGRTILKIAQPYSNHNGGMIAFGRDGYLYIGMGDGGDGGDPGNRAQNKNSLLGKILRINVNGSTSTRNYLIPRTNPFVGRVGRDEVWQRGLRNPWRWSFDKANGNLWIGDVGQGSWEEVDRAVRNSAGPGRGVNWGWRVMEGNHCYNPSSGCNTSGKRRPILEYGHGGSGRCAITGGYVYRGSAIPSLVGWYVYGDYCTGEVWAVPSTATNNAGQVTLVGTGSGRSVSGFGQGDAGELYLCDLNGTVYKFVPA